MRSLLLLVVLIGLLLSAAPGMAQVTTPPVPQIVLSAVDVGTAIRYSAALIKPPELAFDAAYVEVVLPPGVEPVAVLDGTVVPFAGIRRDDAAGHTLIWSAAALTDDAALDALTFFMADELTADLRVYVEYRGATSGAATLSGKPEPSAAIPASAGELILDAAGTGAALLPVGTTGVRVGLLPGLLTDPAPIRARTLPPDANPPADLTGPEGAVFWWCSLVQIDDLPEGVSVPVQVPARLPLAPFTTVRLFAQQPDGTWQPLDSTGVVSADGQFIQYVHPGGTIAAGVADTLRQRRIDAADLPDAPDDLRPGQWLDEETTVSDNDSADALPLADLPTCDQVSDAAIPCRFTPDNNVRVCQPGLLNCLFIDADGRTCYRPTVPDTPFCPGG